MPAKWRTKTGCLTCRVRRKKCDEEVGACRACRRNGLTCIWQSEESLSAGRSPAISTLTESSCLGQETTDYTQYSTLWDSPTFGTPIDQALFDYFASVVLPQFYVPGSQLTCSDDLLSLGIQYRCILDIFLACSAMFLSHGHHNLLPHALHYYCDAVSRTREMIGKSDIQGTEDWLFVVTLFMCLFERLQSGPSSRAVAHLRGATYIMALRTRKAVQFSSEPVTPMQQTCAESLLYNSAITAFLSEEIDWLPEHISWKQIESYIGNLSPTLGSEDIRVPPMGVSPSLCRLILDISCLARRTPLNANDELLAYSLREQLDSWLSPEANSGTVDIATSTSTDADNIRKATNLYAFASDILLLKATQPHIKAEDPQTQNRVKQIMSIIQADVQGLYWNQHYCWPFAILACTVLRETELQFLQGRLEKLWERSYWGDIKRTARVIDHILRARRGNIGLSSLQDCDSGSSQDVFDLLLHKDGLSVFLDR